MTPSTATTTTAVEESIMRDDEAREHHRTSGTVVSAFGLFVVLFGFLNLTVLDIPLGFLSAIDMTLLGLMITLTGVLLLTWKPEEA